MGYLLEEFPFDFNYNAKNFKTDTFVVGLWKLLFICLYLIYYVS